MEVLTDGGGEKTKPKQSQLSAFGRKSEALSTKTETILQNKANFRMAKFT
jgi:hypothetical protein